MRKILLINDTSNEKHLGSSQVIKNIYNLCNLNDLSIIRSLTRKQFQLQNFYSESYYKNADIILINGEGTFHHSPLFFDSLMQSNFKNKKVIIINALWQKMYHTKLNSFLDKCSLISLRESCSYNELGYNYKLSNKITVVPDLIFYTDYKQSKIGYSDSVMSSLKNSLKSYSNYFPLGYIDNRPDIYSYLNWLKTLEIHITGRFHGVCLSVIAETPFLTFPSNSHKIEGLLRDMNCPELLLDSFQNITNKYQIAKDALSKVINYKKLAKQKIENLFKDISKI